MCLKDVLRGSRRILPPEGIDQVVSRDDPVGLQEQEAEDGPGMPAGQRDTPTVSADLDGPEDTKRNPGVTRHDEGTMPRIRTAQGAGLGTRRGTEDAQAHPGRRSRQPVSILERGRRCGVRCHRRLSRWRARRAVGAHEQHDRRRCSREAVFVCAAACHEYPWPTRSPARGDHRADAVRNGVVARCRQANPTSLSLPRSRELATQVRAREWSVRVLRAPGRGRPSRSRSPQYRGRRPGRSCAAAARSHRRDGRRPR